MAAHCPLCQVTSGHEAHTPPAFPPHPPLRAGDAAGRSSRTALLLAQILVLLGVCYLSPFGGLMAVLVNLALMGLCRRRAAAGGFAPPDEPRDHRCRMWRPRGSEP
jgi:hypothetical protein